MGIKRTVKKSADSGVLLESLFNDFIIEKEARNLSPATIESYKNSYARFTNFIGEKNTSEDITASTYFAYIQQLKDEELKITSINHYIRDLRTFLNWCMEREEIKSFKMKLLKEQEVVKQTYTEEEILTLTTKPPRNASFVEWRTWAIVNWVLATGNRAETVCNIKMGDLNFRTMEIKIQHTKNKRAQIIPISRELKIVLDQYIRDYRSGTGQEDYLFCNVGESKLTTNALRQALRDYNLNRDVENTSIHNLRHTFAKQWILNTGDVFRLQKILGHSSLEMTRRYVNMFDDELKHDFDNYNPLDRIKRTQQKKHVVKKETRR